MGDWLRKGPGAGEAGAQTRGRNVLSLSTPTTLQAACQGYYQATWEGLCGGRRPPDHAPTSSAQAPGGGRGSAQQGMGQMSSSGWGIGPILTAILSS